ncbi:CPW-WPC family protein, putative [Plasmodium ovale wallikeri]|uniref:CPW-WPC family protein, putative n=1 Tax=Plasmodium ovale wallikeri TaxID=864142 RepID=A0A1A8YRN4_PLAOA|nr:CPW-WPC family protein, putative [Plasmodium ovale wallikeri]SBT34749.1 CPW-WPC family protein, putative [Plasmodium ovale wallikeri]
MCDVVLLCRVSDGLTLVETNSESKNISHKLELKKLCKKLQTFPNLSTVTSNQFNYHFLIDNGIAYIAVFPVTYPKKLAFLFLNDICKQFNDELMIQYGTHSIDYRSIIETIEKPYSFIKFDRKITKIKQEYKDPRSNIAIKKLNDSLNEVSSIMKKNIDDILLRGENLEDVGRKAFNLKFESEKFKKASRVLSLRYTLYHLLVQNESEKKKKSDETGERKISKYNYGSLKKKFSIEDKEQSKDEKEKEVSNTNGEGVNFSMDGDYPNHEYKKCMDLIEKEFHEKKGDENLKVKEELEKLCLKKKEEDEEEEKMKRIKLQVDGQNVVTEKDKKNKEIKSQLGLSTKLEVSSKLLRESLSEMKNCTRNYRQKCPMNWKVSTSNNLYCVAPDSYIGPCAKKINNDIDISEKIKMEKKCLVFWQCDNNCIQDFENSVCPLDWVMFNEEYCTAPDNYVGNCLTKINFLNMSNKEKSIYSNLCDVRWPCKKNCEHDYSVLCPHGWVEGNNGFCLATSTYKGNCSKKMYLKHLDKMMKQMYEQKCQFSYPCVNACEKNYDELCPNLWQSVNENECAPSEYYNGNCKENYIFKNRNVEEKKLFEKLCDVSYSCLKQCKRDYSYTCPIGWKETLSYCLAPPSYKHSCNKLIKKNMNQKEKIEIGKKCNVFWPCANYEILLKKLIYNNLSEEDYLSVVSGPVDNTTGAVIRA